ncbi:MAG: aspartate/glutamate racemase family protein [Eubacteriales bacterium]|jgi:Asp/Glu/hydantoin racemase
MKRVVFLSTIPSLTPLFTNIAKETLPDVEVFHLVDELIRNEVVTQNRIPAAVYQRMGEHLVACENTGADAVVVTCSSIAPCIGVAPWLVDIPVMRVDEAMAEEAVEMGHRIGIIATVESAVQPTRELLEAVAGKMGKQPVIDSRVCDPGAYQAMLDGQAGLHDEIVAREIVNCMEDHDVLVLAQVSMMTALEKLPPESRKIPVLSSPGPAMRKLKEVLWKGEEKDEL